METEETKSGDAVTSSRIRCVDVPVTLTGLTEAARSLGLPVVARAAGLAPLTDVVGLTLAQPASGGRVGWRVT